MPEEFRNSEGRWRIVIDWPFDEPQHTPLDDLAQVRNFKARGTPADTIVWLPWFFTESTQRDLGRLVLLDQVLTGNRLNEYGAHLSQTDRDQARGLMVNQRDQMRTRIRNCLLAAYGISRADTDAVDDSHDLEGHFISLNPGLELRPPVAASIGDALQDVFCQWLTACYPDHPEFGIEVRRPGLRRVLEVVERAAVDPGKRVEVDRQARSEVRHIAVPLGLGAMGEMHFVLERKWLDELERKQAQHGGDTLSVRELRAWIQEPERRGLDREVQNLLILTFALQKGLRFSLHGQPASPSIEKLDDSLVLVAQALPDADDWERAVNLASTLFGIKASPLMNPQNVAELTDALRHATDQHRDTVGALVDSLKGRMDARGISANGTNRYRTAHATRALLSALAGAEDGALVATLAKADVQTSDAAMAQCVKSARDVAEAMAPDEWRVFDRTDKLAEPYRERVQEIATKLNDAFRHDEHVTQLAAVLQGCQTTALDLLTEAATAPSPKPPETPAPEPPAKSVKGESGVTTGHTSVAATEVDTVFADIRDAVRKSGATRVEIKWTVYSGDEDGNP